MAMSVTNALHKYMHVAIGIEMPVETDGALQSHVAATHKEQTRDAQSPQALYFTETEGEAVRRGLDAPRYRGQSEDIGGQVCHAVPAVCNHGLGIEGPAADELGYRHGKIRYETDVCYPHAGIGSIPGDEIARVVVVVVAT